MSNKTKLYHEELYMPEEGLKSALQAQKEIRVIKFSYHFTKQHLDTTDYKHHLDKAKILLAISKMSSSSPVKPFEIEMTQGSDDKWYLTKYVVRVPYDYSRDCSIVVLVAFDSKTNKQDFANAFIKTVWLNSKEDTHKTLDLSKYSPED